VDDRVTRVTNARSGRTRLLGFGIVGGLPGGDHVQRIRVTPAGQVAGVGARACWTASRPTCSSLDRGARRQVKPRTAPLALLTITLATIGFGLV
jgi:hypothetical protein